MTDHSVGLLPLFPWQQRCGNRDMIDCGSWETQSYVW